MSPKFYIFFAITIIHVRADCPQPLKDCPKDKISFYLFTEKDKPYQLLLDNPDSIKNAPFHPQTDFKLIIHGLDESKDAPIMVKIREEYFKQNPCRNLLYIDYKPLATLDCYFETAVASVPKIGECTANMLKLIFQQRPDINIQLFQGVGFSLGAQILAYISNSLKPLVLPYILGLDPALPGFIDIATEGALTVLNKQHAHLVVVIHSNAGALGVTFSAAHRDIYLNDGTSQPGCDKNDTPIVCSHDRAVDVFIETINLKETFIGRKCTDQSKWINNQICDGTQDLQIHIDQLDQLPTDPKQLGILQVKTKAKSPFGQITP